MKPPRETAYATEKDFTTNAQKRIREEFHGEVIHVVPGGANKRGTPDLLACIDGRFVAIELKQPSKEPTPLQLKRLRDWARAGALAGWVTTEFELDELLLHLGDRSWVNDQLAGVGVVG